MCLCARYSLNHTRAEIDAFYRQAGLRAPHEYRDYLNYDVCYL
jgi:hypothetical protein